MENLRWRQPLPLGVSHFSLSIFSDSASNCITVVNQAFVPKLPLREPLIASQDGAFTEFTVTQRLPNLARRVIAENNFSSPINQGLVNQVKLHLKSHPTFVSDATISDVHYTINYFAASGNCDVTNVAHRLQNYLKSKRLLLVDNYFWTSPLPFWQLPPSLREELAASALIIIKGDANYRRLLGDRKWDFSTNIDDIVCYLPVPMVALRTLKSEVAVGIPPQTVENVAKIDANWLTNGQWGLIQFVA